METKEYPANSGAPVSTLQSYSDGVAECDPTSGFLACRKGLDTTFLTALIYQGDRAQHCLPHVQANDFYNPVYGDLFNQIMKVAATGTLTPMRVLDTLTSTRWTKDSYWHGRVLNLVAPGSGGHEDIALAASLLVQGSLRQQVQTLGMELNQVACERSLEELMVFLADSARMEMIRATVARLEALTALTGGVK